MVCRHILAGIESNLECGYVLDIRWANPKVARVLSRSQIPQIDASGRSLPPALTMSSGSLQILQKVWSLRDEERRDREATFGTAYSCWRNVTGTDDCSHLVLC